MDDFASDTIDFANADDHDVIVVDADDVVEEVVEEVALRQQPPLRVITPAPARASWNVFAALGSVVALRRGSGFHPSV